MSDLSLDPIPNYGYPVEGIDKPLSQVYYRWLSQLYEIVIALVRVISSLVYSGSDVLTAALSPTDLGITNGGTYRISWALRITQAATVSSSVTVSVSYSDDAIAVTQSGAAVTGNLITTVQGGNFTLTCDPNSPVTISTAYASVGATACQYKLAVKVERLP